jgi:hypothetical protein
MPANAGAPRVVGRTITTRPDLSARLSSHSMETLFGLLVLLVSAVIFLAIARFMLGVAEQKALLEQILMELKKRNCRDET